MHSSWLTALALLLLCGGYSCGEPANTVLICDGLQSRALCHAFHAAGADSKASVALGWAASAPDSCEQGATHVAAAFWAEVLAASVWWCQAQGPPFHTWPAHPCMARDSVHTPIPCINHLPPTPQMHAQASHYSA